MFKRTVLALSLLLFMLACASGRRASELRPGDHTFSLDVDGRERSYVVHVPSPAEAGAALPVVLVFHGGGGNAESMQQYSGMDATADAHSFLAVYPNGTGPLRQRLLTWNAGACCGYALENDVDDVAFVAALLDDLAERTPMDTTRVYATGLSNGAMMSYQLAAALPERVAAIAPVAGVVPTDAVTPTQPVPLMHIHSVDDPRALYEGGLGPPFPMTNHRVEHAPVEAVLAFWSEAYGCPAKPAQAELLEGPPGAADEAHTATRLVYEPCEAGATIVFWKLTGAGHVWPGSAAGNLDDILGESTTVLDANGVIWAFFEAHSLPREE